ncbi:MAG TPA: DinB family protein [Thermomicrobiales bacterium]
MTTSDPGRPATGEYLPYYEPYIRRVPDGDLRAIFARQIAETAAFFAPFSPEQARWRPAPGEWSVIEIVGHLADSERIFSYRALRIARNDPTPLPGADLEAYVPAAGFESRTLADVVGEYAAVRQATLALLRGLDAAAWTRRGTADGNPISVRALAYILAGHETHHVEELRQSRDW